MEVIKEFMEEHPEQTKWLVNSSGSDFDINDGMKNLIAKLDPDRMMFLLEIDKPPKTK